MQKWACAALTGVAHFAKGSPALRWVNGGTSLLSSGGRSGWRTCAALLIYVMLHAAAAFAVLCGLPSTLYLLQGN